MVVDEENELREGAPPTQETLQIHNVDPKEVFRKTRLLLSETLIVTKIRRFGIHNYSSVKTN